MKRGPKVKFEGRIKTWRATAEDEKLMAEIKAKTGIVSESDLVRMGLRKFAQAEGLTGK